MKELVTSTGVDMCKLLKESEVSAHFWHLTTLSYAEHKAFDKYYTELADHFDTLVECVQGMYDIRIELPTSLTLVPYKDKMDHFAELCDVLDLFIKETDQHLNIQDIVIDIKNLVDKTKYLLSLN
jgi:hypothetical protein